MGVLTRAIGDVLVDRLGEQAMTGPAVVVGTTQSNDHVVDAGDRAGSGEVSRGAAFADASGSGCADRTGFRVDHRESRTISVWEADRELSGTGAVGGLEWETATTGAYHQTGEFDVALLVGGSCPSYGTQHPGMAQ